MATIDERIIPVEAVHPTELIIDEIKERGIRRKDMAIRLGMQPSNFSRMLKQKETITPQMANKLEEALGIPASMWLNLQAEYDRDVVAISQRNRDEQEWAVVEKMLSGMINIALLFKHLGVDSYAFAKDRISYIYEKLGVDSAEAVLSIAQPLGCFKKSDKLAVDDKNLKTWVLLAYSASVNKIVEHSYRKGCVDEVATDIAGEANKGTITEEYIERRLSSNGIGYTYVEKLDKAPVDAYSSIINGTPYIVVSHRHNNMDMLVFDVLHELHHIDVDLVEGASNVSFNRDADDDNDEREMAANKYAEDMLIPKATWEKILRVQSRSISPYSVYNAVADEAIKYGISPSIASWRYKHQTNVYNLRGYQSPKIK